MLRSAGVDAPTGGLADGRAGHRARAGRAAGPPRRRRHRQRASPTSTPWSSAAWRPASRSSTSSAAGGSARLDLLVDRRVLIPRPETEVRRDTLAELDRLVPAGTSAVAPVVVDLGTGPGALAWPSPPSAPALEVWGTDVLGRRVWPSPGRTWPGSAGRRPGSAWPRGLVVRRPAPRPGGADRRDRVEPAVRVRGRDGRAPRRGRATGSPERRWSAGPTGLEASNRSCPRLRAGWRGRGRCSSSWRPTRRPPPGLGRCAAGFASVTVWPDLAGRDRIVLARL